jgi:hypothetical protein
MSSENSFSLFSRIANKHINCEDYLHIWEKGDELGLKKTDRKKIEDLEIIGHGNVTLKSIVGDCKSNFEIPLWIVHCAITQFGTHGLLGRRRQDRFNTIGWRWRKMPSPDSNLEPHDMDLN